MNEEDDWLSCNCCGREYDTDISRLGHRENRLPLTCQKCGQECCAACLDFSAQAERHNAKPEIHLCPHCSESGFNHEQPVVSRSLLKAMQIAKQRRQNVKTEASVSPAVKDEPVSTNEEEKESNSPSVKYDIGVKVSKHFKGHGWYDGEVVQCIDYEELGIYYRISYEDDDVEDIPEAEMEDAVAHFVERHTPKGGNRKREKSDDDSDTSSELPILTPGSLSPPAVRTEVAIKTDVKLEHLAFMNESSSEDETDRKMPAGSISVKYEIGTKVSKYFEGYGWFDGEVVKKTDLRNGGTLYCIRYEDNDEEEISQSMLEEAVGHYSNRHGPATNSKKRKSESADEENVPMMDKGGRKRSDDSDEDSNVMVSVGSFRLPKKAKYSGWDGFHRHVPDVKPGSFRDVFHLMDFLFERSGDEVSFDQKLWTDARSESKDGKKREGYFTRRALREKKDPRLQWHNPNGLWVPPNKESLQGFIEVLLEMAD